MCLRERERDKGMLRVESIFCRWVDTALPCARYCVAFDGSEIAQEHAYYLKYQNLRSVRTSHAHFVHAHA